MAKSQISVYTGKFSKVVFFFNEGFLLYSLILLNGVAVSSRNYSGANLFFFCAAINLPICSLEYIKEIMPQGDVFHLCNVCEKLFLFYPLRRVKTWN